MITFKIEGSNTIDSKLEAYKQKLGQKVQRGIMEAAKTLLAESLLQVPKDTTALMNDGHVRQEDYGLNTKAVVGYGTYGFAAIGYSQKEGKLVVREPSTYAVIVHQDYTKDHDVGTGSGYLENPKLTKQTEIRAAFNIGFEIG